MARLNLWKKRKQTGPKPPVRSTEMPCLRADWRRLRRKAVKEQQHIDSLHTYRLQAAYTTPNRAQRRTWTPATVLGTKVLVRLRHGKTEFKVAS